MVQFLSETVIIHHNLSPYKKIDRDFNKSNYKRCPTWDDMTDSDSGGLIRGGGGGGGEQH